MLFFNPAEFSVSASDINLGSLLNSSSGWNVSSTSQPQGYLDISVTNGLTTGTGGGTLVTVNFHVLSDAPLGPTPVDLAADASAGPGGAAIGTYIAGANGQFAQTYQLNPAPIDNVTSLSPFAYSGTDPDDGAITVVPTADSGTQAATHFSITALSNNVTVGQSRRFVVAALDAAGDTAIGYTGTVTFSSSDSQAILPANATLSSGVGVFSATYETAGSQTLTATDLAATTVNGSGTISVSPLPTTHFAIELPANFTAGAGFRFTVTAENQNNVLTTGFTGTVDFTSSDSLARLPADSTLASGLGTFSATLFSAGSQSLIAADLPNELSFSEASGTPIAAGPDPTDLVVADFTGDGRSDLAVTNDSSPGSVTILLSNGNGTFQAGRSYAVGANPSDIAVADLNGDGKPDLITTDYYSNTVTVLLGNGNGTFGPATTYAVGDRPKQVVAADFNGDGKPDLAVTNYFSDTVSVLLGNGNGTFQVATTYAVGNGPTAIVAGDFSHDGRLDLAVANYDSSYLSLLLGNGDGTFSAANTYSVGGGVNSLDVGDYNGDGNLDLAAVNESNPTISILLGNGDGTFQAAPIYYVAVNASRAASADFNGDGNLDLALTTGGSISVLLGNGNGTFLPEQNSGVTMASADAVAVGNFGGDGLPDLAVANSAYGTVTVLLNQEVAGLGTTIIQAARPAISSLPGQVALSSVRASLSPLLRKTRSITSLRTLTARSASPAVTAWRRCRQTTSWRAALGRSAQRSRPMEARPCPPPMSLSPLLPGPARLSR